MEVGNKGTKKALKDMWFPFDCQQKLYPFSFIGSCFWSLDRSIYTPRRGFCFARAKSYCVQSGACT